MTGPVPYHQGEQHWRTVTLHRSLQSVEITTTPAGCHIGRCSAGDWEVKSQNAIEQAEAHLWNHR